MSKKKLSVLLLLGILFMAGWFLGVKRASINQIGDELLAPKACRDITSFSDCNNNGNCEWVQVPGTNNLGTNHFQWKCRDIRFRSPRPCTNRNPQVMKVQATNDGRTVIVCSLKKELDCGRAKAELKSDASTVNCAKTPSSDYNIFTCNKPYSELTNFSCYTVSGTKDNCCASE